MLKKKKKIQMANITWVENKWSSECLSTLWGKTCICVCHENNKDNPWESQKAESIGGPMNDAAYR